MNIIKRFPAGSRIAKKASDQTRAGAAHRTTHLDPVQLSGGLKRKQKFMVHELGRWQAEGASQNRLHAGSVVKKAS